MDKIKIDLFDNSYVLHRPRNPSFCFRLIILVFVVFVVLSEQSIILGNIKERENHRDKSLKLIPCTVTFIEKYFEYPDRISLFLPDAVQNISDFVEPFVSELRTQSSVYTLNAGIIDITETYDSSTDTVILSENAIALERNDSYFMNYCRRDCDIVIVLTSPFNDEESFLAEADLLVQQMWSQSIFKLAILASVGDSVLSAGSLPIRIDGLYAPAQPTIMDRCAQEAIAIQRRSFTNKIKLLDSSIHVAMFENFPYALYTNSTKYLKFQGIEGTMVEEIARSMKVELKREVIEWTNKTDINNELYKRLFNATDDLVFGGLLWSFGPQSHTGQRSEYTTCYGMVHVTWIVPKTTNVSLYGLITPFGPNVWYATICVLIVGALVKFFIIRDITFLDITGLILGVSVRQPTKLSSRIQFISWVLFGFFLMQLYLGSLADQLMRVSDLQIETMEEIVNSGLQVGGTNRFLHLFQPDKGDDDNIKRTIRKNYITFKQHDYIEHITNIIEGKNTTLALLVMLNLTDIRYIINVGHAHVLKETVGSYPLALATWHGFPYLGEFNFKIQVLVQAGIVEYWSDMAALNDSHHTHDDEEDDSVDIMDLVPAFLLLIIGYVGGFCLLIIEVIFYPTKMLS